MVQDILQRIKAIAQTGDELYCKVGTVKEVNEAAKTCTVAIDDEADIYEVMYAFGDTYTLTPNKGSYVLIAFVSKHTAAIVYCEEITAFQIEIEGITFNLSSKGFELANNMTSMGKVMADLAQNIIDALSAIQLFNYNYINPAGTPTPTGPAVNAATLETYKMNLTTLKNQLSNFIK